MTQRVTIIEKIMDANDRLAQENRARLDRAGVFSINIMASPGAGKTSVILKTIEALNPGLVFFPLSCTTGEGLDAWLDWLREHVSKTAC